MEFRDELLLASRFSVMWHGFSITVDDRDEIRHDAQRIRCDVEAHEPRSGSRTDRHERDSLVRHHHLVVRSSTSGEPVAACRLTSSTLTNRFQSATAFSIEKFLIQPGIKVELGDMWIRHKWRDNITLSAIGHGLGRYIRRHSATWIFGCSGFPDIDTVEVAKLVRHFTVIGACARSFGVLPHARYTLPGLAEAAAQADRQGCDQERMEALIPPLLRLCLKAGAGISAEPALDERTGQVIFFTVMGMSAHRASFLSRYLPC